MLLLQETLVANEKKTPKFAGFHLVRWDKEGRKWGGLLTLLREYISFREVKLPFTVKNEVCLINIKLEENRCLSVVNYYKRATVNFDLNQFKR